VNSFISPDEFESGHMPMWNILTSTTLSNSLILWLMISSHQINTFNETDGAAYGC
jgi:hypothetical protein